MRKFRMDSFVSGKNRHVPIQIVPSVMGAVKNGFMPPPKWLHPMILVPPAPPPPYYGKPRSSGNLEEKLQQIWLERHPNAKKISMVASEVGYEKYWHHPAASFSWRQARLMKQGFPQEEAYEIVEEQDRKAREYRQIERKLAIEQLEELGAKEIDTGDRFLAPSVFEHKPIEMLLEEIIELRKKRGIRAPLDAREFPKGTSFLEIRRLVEKRPEFQTFIDLRRLGPLFEATGVPVPLTPETDSSEENLDDDMQDDEDKPVFVTESKPVKEVDLNSDEVKGTMYEWDLEHITDLQGNILGDGETLFADWLNGDEEYSREISKALNTYTVDKWKYYLYTNNMNRHALAMPLFAWARAEDNYPSHYINAFDGMAQSGGTLSEGDAEDFKPYITPGKYDEDEQAAMARDEAEEDEILEEEDTENMVAEYMRMTGLKVVHEGEDENEGEKEEEDEEGEEDEEKLFDDEEEEEEGEGGGDFKKKYTGPLLDFYDYGRTRNFEERFRGYKSMREPNWESVFIDTSNAVQYDPRLNPTQFRQIHDEEHAAALRDATQAVRDEKEPPLWDSLLMMLEAGETVRDIKQQKELHLAGKKKKKSVAERLKPRKTLDAEPVDSSRE